MSASEILIYGSLGFLLFLAMMICVIGICQCSNTKYDFEPDDWVDKKWEIEQTKGEAE